jgi:hypothetical protein
LYIHEEYINPDEILRRKDIYLYYLTPEHVVFGMVAPGDDIYNPVKYPFQIIFNIKAVK